MKTFFLAFRNCPTFLTIASLTSLVLFLCNIFWWMTLEPIFQVAPKIGELANLIFSSIITGHIFYAIVNQIKENKDKENIKQIVSKYIEEIYKENEHLFNEYFKVCNYSPKKIPFELEEIKTILNGIETTLLPPLISYGFPKPINFTWYQVAQTSRHKVRTEINNILRFSNLLDTEFINILNRIERSTYFEMIDGMAIFGKDFNKFTLFADSYLQHQNLNIELIRFGLKENWLILTNEEKSFLKKMLTTGFNEEEMIKLKKIGDNK
jgi:hypothetical protein